MITSTAKQYPPLALVDVDAMYASCERLFQPQLLHQPVIVVGSGDNCIVARSAEVKALGIPMGAPVFQYQAQITRYGIAVCSSNFTLYSDLSARLYATVGQFSSEVEAYSIDECFLSMPALSPAGLAAHAQDIKTTVLRWVGLPVSVGVAASKTLCKVACKQAKKTGAGVLVLQDEAEIDALLATLPVEEVWGIGPRRAAILAQHRVFTARDLRDAPDRLIKQKLSVMGLRTVLELRGIPCLPLDLAPQPKQHIACAQVFGEDVTDLASLKAAVASYMVRAAERLRKQHAQADHVSVFLQTNPFRTTQAQYARSGSCTLAEPTSATSTLISAAHQMLARLYRPGFAFHRAGVFLQGLVPEIPTQLSFFTAPEQQAKQQALYTAIEAINQRFGRGTITFAAVGKAQRWRAKQANKSPSYTTSEFPVVK